MYQSPVLIFFGLLVRHSPACLLPATGVLDFHNEYVSSDVVHDAVLAVHCKDEHITEVYSQFTPGLLKTQAFILFPAWKRKIISSSFLWFN